MLWDIGVIAVDYNSIAYLAIAYVCNVKVIKADLERDRPDLLDENVNCVVFTEVLKYLNPYYVSIE